LRFDDLRSDVGAQPVVRVGEVQRRQPFDALDPVGNRIDMNAQDPGGLLKAFVLVQVNGQGPDEIDLVPGTVVDLLGARACRRPALARQPRRRPGRPPGSPLR
jgi:hypothetical protein